MKVEFKKSQGPLDALHFFGIFGVFALLVAAFFPFKKFNVPLCTFRTITGVPCPTCGMTTCFVLIMHGHFISAVHASPLGIFVFIFTAFAVLYLIATLFLKLPVIRIKMKKFEKIVFWIVLGLLVAANWIYNILHLMLHKI